MQATWTVARPTLSRSTPATSWVDRGDQTIVPWAQKAIADPFAYAAMMRSAMVSDSGWTTASADTDAGDTALQTIVETLVNTAFKNK